MQNRKILNILVILSCIFVIVSFVLAQTIATDYFKNMFWVASMFLMCSVLLDLNAWSKLGLDVDKNKSKTIRRGFDDSTTLLVVFYGSLLLIIVFFNQFNSEVMKNNYVIIGYFIMTIEFVLFNYLSIWNAKKDTVKLLKDNK